jgi:hypothetical protein
MKKIALIATILLTGFAVIAGSDDLYIYPNPAHDQMYVQIPDSFMGITYIMIRDMKGKMIYQGERFLDANEFRKTLLSVVDLPNGVYLLQVTNNENEVVSEFMKQ